MDCVHQESIRLLKDVLVLDKDMVQRLWVVHEQGLCAEGASKLDNTAVCACNVSSPDLRHLQGRHTQCCYLLMKSPPCVGVE